MPKTIPVPKGGVAYVPPEPKPDKPAKAKPNAEQPVEEKAKRQPSERSEFLRKRREERDTEWEAAHPKSGTAEKPKRIASIGDPAKQIEALESMIRTNLGTIDRARAWIDELKANMQAAAAA
jgi:hypothetical protein